MPHSNYWGQATPDPFPPFQQIFYFKIYGSLLFILVIQFIFKIVPMFHCSTNPKFFAFVETNILSFSKLTKVSLSHFILSCKKYWLWQTLISISPSSWILIRFDSSLWVFGRSIECDLRHICVYLPLHGGKRIIYIESLRRPRNMLDIEELKF